MQPALLTVSGRRIHGSGSGLNTGDKKKHRHNPFELSERLYYKTRPFSQRMLSILFFSRL
jgi:hypothetical protein